ncbi:hypothetical protein [Aerococcus christensenii]
MGQVRTIGQDRDPVGKSVDGLIFKTHEDIYNDREYVGEFSLDKKIGLHDNGIFYPMTIGGNRISKTFFLFQNIFYMGMPGTIDRE